MLRFGYADDICIYRISKTIEGNVERLTADIENITNWGRENKVVFAPEKTEMIHLTRKRNSPALTIPLEDRTILEPIITTEKPYQKPALK